MAYDEELANRIQRILEGTDGLKRKKLFGGLGFLVNGHLAASAYKGGDLMIRCGPADWSSFCAEPGARPMTRQGKPVSGWVIIDAQAVEQEAPLRKWIERGRDFAESQPPK